MSNDQSPPIRKVSAYKAGKRLSTVRKLNIDFAGTALEEALMLQAQINSSELMDKIPNPPANESIAYSQPQNSSLSNNVTSSVNNNLQEKGELSLSVNNIIYTTDLIQDDQIDLNADDNSDQIDLNTNDQPDHTIKINQNTSEHTNKIFITRSVSNLVDKQLSHSNQVDKQPSRLSTKLEDTQANISSLAQNNLQDSQLSTKLFNNQLPGYKTPNILDDEIMPTLTPSEQVILRRLFRLSYGFNRTITDTVSYSKLSEKCHLGLSAVKDALKSLQMKNLIKAIGNNKHNPIGGNCYLLTLPFPSSLVEGKDKNKDSRLSAKPFTNLVDSQPSPYSTKLVNGSINHDDDLNNTNHHLSETMMIYQKITGNSWTKADSENYTKIKGIPVDKIEVAIRLANQRAINRPNSLAYFVKEILASIKPPQQNRTQRKKALEKIIDRISHSYIGSSRSISDFSYDVKEACIREDVPFDLDVFNDIMAKGKS